MTDKLSIISKAIDCDLMDCDNIAKIIRDYSVDTFTEEKDTMMNNYATIDIKCQDDSYPGYSRYFILTNGKVYYVDDDCIDVSDKEQLMKDEGGDGWLFKLDIHTVYKYRIYREYTREEFLKYLKTFGRRVYIFCDCITGGCDITMDLTFGQFGLHCNYLNQENKQIFDNHLIDDGELCGCIGTDVSFGTFLDMLNDIFDELDIKS